MIFCAHVHAGLDIFLTDDRKAFVNHYLKHILRCTARIEEYTTAGRETFFSSHLIQA